MKWRQVLPSLVTLAAMLSGFISILVTFEGLRQEDPHIYRWAALLIMLAMILDGLDGNLARWLKGQSAFGAELDTYVDMTAFGIAPAILVFAVSLQENDPFWRVLLPSAVALSGVVRLARFKVMDPLRGQGGYGGLPITVNAAWVALLVFLSQTPSSTDPDVSMFSLSTGWMKIVFLMGVVVFILLQVSTFRYPKPTKYAWIFAVCMLLVAGLWYRPTAVPTAKISIALGISYVVAGPAILKMLAKHKSARAAAGSPDGNGDNNHNGD